MYFLLTIILTIAHVLVAISLITFILIQEGNDGGMSGVFGGGGGGGSQSFVRRKRGMEEKVVRLTAVFAGLFFILALLVAII